VVDCVTVIGKDTYPLELRVYGVYAADCIGVIGKDTDPLELRRFVCKPMIVEMLLVKYSIHWSYGWFLGGGLRPPSVYAGPLAL
jgi:hypothetical protein